MGPQLPDSTDLRGVLEALPEGICVCRDFKPHFVNAAYARLHGYAHPDQILALGSILELMPAEQHALSRERAASLMTGGQAPERFQERQRRKDGSEFAAEKTLRVISWEGEPALLIVMTEATNSAHMAVALGEGEQRLRDFAEVASDWFWETDRDHRFTHLSDRFLEATGVQPKSRIGKRRTEIALPMADPTFWDRHLADLEAHVPFRNLTYSYLDIEGRVRHLRANGKPVFASEGEFLGYRGTGTDISSEVEALNRAEREHRRLVDAIENIPAAFFTFDADERIEIINENIRRIYPRSPLLRTPGAKYEDMMRWSVEHGELRTGSEDAETWIRKRLEAFRDPPESFEMQLGDGRWVKGLDRKTAAGGTVCIRVDITEQKRREEALRASQEALRQREDQLQAILDHSPALIYIKDPRGRYLLLNREYERRTGLSSKDLLGKTTSEIYPAKTAAQLIEHDRQVLQRREPAQFEESVPTARGLRHFVSVRFPLFDASGGIVGIGGISTDITERKLQEQALRTSEERFRNLIEGSIQGILVHRASRPLFANAAFARMFGFASTEELLALESTNVLIAREDRERTSQYYHARLRGDPVPTRYTFKGIRIDGSPILVETMARVVDWEGGRAVQGTYFDITERHEAEERLRASEERFRNLVEGSIQGIVVHSGLANLFLNESFAKIFGYESVAELKALPSLHVLIAPRELERLVGYHRSRLEGGEAPVYYQWEGVRKDGSRVWLDAISRVVDWNGSPAVQTTLLDITRRKMLEEELRQSQKMEAIGKLAGGIAHDFNNLLQVISGFTRLALADLPATEPLHRDLEMVQQATERAAGLTRQLLAFSRRQVLNPTDLNLNDLVTNMVRLLERLIERHIAVSVVPGEAVPTVRADAGMIEQVLMNLCVNARDAMPSGGHLVIETRNAEFDEAYCRQHPWARTSRYALIMVTDTGIGIPPEARDHIFEPFFTTKEIGKGTGLGLSTVYGIVQQHDGFITVDSIPGTGSTFRVYLPAATATSEPPGAAEAQSLAGGGETILVVEDEPGVEGVAKRTLMRNGYRVLTVGDGLEALKLLHAQPGQIDLVLLDLIMPRMTGGEAYRRLREAAPDIRIVLATGYSASVPQSQGERAPAVLHKPYSPDRLLATVRSVLDRA